MAVDKSFNSKHTNTENEKSVSSKTAMMDYYDDVLGSIDEDPLKKLEEAEQRKKQISGVQVVTTNGSNTGNDNISSDSLSRLKVRPKPKLKAKTPAPSFAEPEIKKISPLIIPAAFPKLAPEKNVIETTVQPAVEQKVAPKTETKVAEKKHTKRKSALTKAQPKAKIDRESALKILEKKRSKLSPEQVLRLEEKLGLSNKAKSDFWVQSTSNEVKPAVIKTTKGQDLVQINEKRDQAESLAPVENSQSKIQLKQNALVNEKGGEPHSIKPGQPAWAQDRFECLIFTVAGLKLAVPLISLGAVYKIEKELTPIPGRAQHFMGLYRHLDRNVRVVDTAQWVMPDRWSLGTRDNYKFIIRLGGSDWGLACDSVAESIQLTSEQVKWRTERTKRSWLFGTVIGHMCALLDADMLGSMLEDKAS